MIWIIFGAMLLAGTLVVAVPILRTQKRFSGLSASAIVCTVAIAVSVYYLVGTPFAPSAQPPGQSIESLVAHIDASLKANPDDVAAWKMLGRLHMQQTDYAGAIDAFREAMQREGGKDGQTMADLGEAMLFDQDGSPTRESSQLFDSALSMQPNNPKALFYSGLAAIARNDRELAANRWEALLATAPPPEIQEVLKQRIAEWRGEPAPASTAAPPAPVEGALLNVAVSLGEAPASVLEGDASVYVIARDPAQPSPPVAVARRRLSELPDTVSLGDGDSMIPGRLLSAFATLELVARVSLSGQPIAQPGDWYGQVEVKLAEGRDVRIVIDRQVTE